MKKVVVMVLVIFCMAIGVAYADSEAPSIAVFPLRGQSTQTGVIGNPAEMVIQMVTEAFYKTKRFNVIERSQLNKIFAEQKYQTSGDVDDGSAIDLGKQLGAKFVVVGSYDITQTRTVDYSFKPPMIQFPSKCDINLRVVDVQTGKITDTVKILARAKEGEGSSAYEKLKEDAIRKLEREVGNKYPMAGYVIKVLSEKEALIDIGSKNGITEDTEFSVFEYGEDIVHPITKKIIKGEKKLITEFKVKSVADETSIVKISGDDAKLKVGLMLESKPKSAGFAESLGNFFNR